MIEDDPRAGSAGALSPCQACLWPSWNVTGRSSDAERRPTATSSSRRRERHLSRSNFRQRVWLPATRSVGLDGLRFHNLRHTAGTLAARTGATTKELMARLGHASPRASMIYQHAAEDRDRRIAEGLDAMAVEAGLRPPEPASPRQLTASPWLGSGTPARSNGPRVTPHPRRVRPR